MITPKDCIPLLPFMVNTFGKAELEHAAVLLTCWHLETGYTHTWSRVAPYTILDWALSTPYELVAKLRGNPFFNPDFKGLREAGYIDGWSNPQHVGRFSQKALDLLATRLGVKCPGITFQDVTSIHCLKNQGTKCDTCPPFMAMVNQDSQAAYEGLLARYPNQRIKEPDPCP